MVLLFGIFLVWSMVNMPSQEEQMERQRLQDSIALAASVEPEKLTTSPDSTQVGLDGVPDESVDSLKTAQISGQYGDFAGAVSGTEEFFTLENEDIKVTFSNKGGRVTEALLKKYQKIVLDEDRKEQKVPLYLMEDKKNEFEYILPLAGREIRSGDLFFGVNQSPGKITFTARGSDGTAFTQSYELGESGYSLKYDIGLARSKWRSAISEIALGELPG